MVVDYTHASVHMATVGPNSGLQTGEEQERLRTLVEASLPAISPESARVLAEAGRIRRVPVHGPMFRQGAEVRLTLLLSGLAGFQRTTSDGQQITVRIAHPGELFGITSISGTISSVDMIALTDSVVAAWSG